jgi:hypothetical protein
MNKKIVNICEQKFTIPSIIKIIHQNAVDRYSMEQLVN